MNSIVPVLLAGGFGTRLWPISRRSYPKQFTQILGEKSLFQQLALRLTSSKKIIFEQQITLTNSDYRFIVNEQLEEIKKSSGTIILEPESKNTAPAILSATLLAHKENKDSILLVAPSDHHIQNTSKFHEILNIGLKEVINGKIITFGIQPTYPETGYGYLELDKESSGSVVNLIRFVEKPSKSKAIEMFNLGNYLWNSGIFLFRSKDLIEAFKEYEPQLLSIVQKALRNSVPDLNFLRLNSDNWALCKKTSIDYAIMEKAKNLSVVPFSSGWSDLGDWNAIKKEMHTDQKGISKSKNAFAFDCSNTLLRSESDQQVVVGLGLKDIIAVTMPDAVLIAHKDKAQEVNKAVTKLKNHNINKAEIFPKVHRPWGSFEILATTNFFQVKKIFVKSEAALSLQSHQYRSEHWVVVEGTAKVTIDDKVTTICEGQSIYVPLGSTHRLQNTTKLPVILIEIQIGSYLGEDDIIRYEDLYSRN